MSNYPLVKIIIGCFVIIAFWPLAGQAATVKNVYPRVANYFLRWEITDHEAKELAKWDLLILDMEVQENSRRELEKIRALNPEIIILAYITSQEILDNVDNYRQAYLRQKLNEGLSDGWWLRDKDGHKVSNWPYTSMFNLSNGAKPNSSGQLFNEYLPEFVNRELKASGLWDGVFYDNVWGDVAWVKASSLDLNNDGQVETNEEADRMWAAGFYKMLAYTRELVGPDFIIVGNGRVYDGYQGLLNGMMLESFPSAWENNGTWSGSMATYLKLPQLNTKPSLPIINIYDKNQTNYRHVRFGLASTLLGNGYFSYDYDVANHGQTWWYDEYDISLGSSLSAPYNLLNGNDTTWQPGLWRRDFKNGTALVNSTKKKQTYIFRNEELEKINGNQDSQINNGQKINYITLEPEDGIILKRTALTINNSSFANGYFYRTFNQAGKQQNNGFFAYNAAYPGGSAVTLAVDDVSGNTTHHLSAKRGWVTLHQDGRAVASFAPYTKNFKRDLSVATEIENGYFKRIVTGAGAGGGPQVGIFLPNGRVEYSWFAYDKSLRNGVNVALADLDDDGELEVVTGPGIGQEPLVKIFSISGQLRNSFLAYPENFKGGVEVAAGDINGDGLAEIITAPASGGGPQVMIFNQSGKRLDSWFAYSNNMRGGYKLSLSDVNSDGALEILVGIKNF